MKQDTKDKMQYGSALAMIASGIVLTFLSFFTLKFVHSSVLAYVGEAVAFAGAVFGLGVYARSKGVELDEKFDELAKEIKKSNKKE